MAQMVMHETSVWNVYTLKLGHNTLLWGLHR